MLGYLYGKRFGSKIAWANWQEGDRVGGRVQVEKQAVEGDDPHRGHGYECEGNTARVGARKVSHAMVEIKLLCFRWLSPFLKLV